MQKLRQYFIGFLIALTPLVGYVGYGIFKDFSLMRQQNAAIINYLAEPIGKNDKGEVITRADVLAAVAKRVADASVQQGNSTSGTVKGDSK